MITICYPEYRQVSEDQIMTWAYDAHANGEISYLPDTLEAAVRELEDVGHITVDRRPFNADKAFAEACIRD